MVKGIARRVVVVRPPDSGATFEQAIFFLRDDGVKKDALREACAVAEDYLRTAPRRVRGRWFSRRQLFLSFSMGALSMGMLWTCAALLF